MINKVDLREKWSNEELIWFSALSIGLFFGVIVTKYSDLDGVLSYAAYAAIFIVSLWINIVHIEKTGLVDAVTGYKSTKILVGIVVSAFLLYSSIHSASLINEVFLVDSSALLFTNIIGQLLSLASILGPVFAVYLFLCWEFVGPSPSDWFLHQNFELKLFVIKYTFIVNGLIVGILGTFMTFKIWTGDGFKENIALIAEYVDFSRHSCKNISPENKVIFIGPNQLQALVQLKANDGSVSYQRDECEIK